jgi:anthranilate synthase/aminodeoxychorismate synthase-like glutamine amidotransferase
VILVIDNYDSFTYNLVQYLGILGAELDVRRNDEVTLEEVVAMRPERILLSPGPCTPNESGVCLDVLQEALDGTRLAGVPIFGVCLGMQAMGLVAGAEIRRARTIRHGKTSPVEHDGEGVFAGVPNPVAAIRYHSLVIEATTLNDDWKATAFTTDDQELMGIRHRHLPLEGVQFHPESVLTESGLLMMENFLSTPAAPVLA